jgi:hypothetical protein
MIVKAAGTRLLGHPRSERFFLMVMSDLLSIRRLKGAGVGPMRSRVVSPAIAPVRDGLMPSIRHQAITAASAREYRGSTGSLPLLAAPHYCLPETCVAVVVAMDDPDCRWTVRSRSAVNRSIGAGDIAIRERNV